MEARKVTLADSLMCDFAVKQVLANLQIFTVTH